MDPEFCEDLIPALARSLTTPATDCRCSLSPGEKFLAVRFPGSAVPYLYEGTLGPLLVLLNVQVVNARWLLGATPGLEAQGRLNGTSLGQVVVG